MQAFVFLNVILHKLPDGKGWEIIGLRNVPRREEVVATFTTAITQEEAEHIANWFALKLAGKSYAQMN